MRRRRPYLIANPIYDVVIKALLADLELARDILSLILGLEIVSLRFAAQEVAGKSPVTATRAGTTKRKSGGALPGTMRLDFCAVIRTAEGICRQVLIELQKSRLSGDILRFRRYLSERYMILEEVQWDDGTLRPEPLPILCLYLLGFEIDPRLPLVTRVERRYVDAVRSEEVSIPKKDRPNWIESLTHDAWFVQIPRLQGGADLDNRLERLLSIFDQTKQVAGDAHRLDYDDSHGKLMDDELLSRVLRRLHKLQADPEMERIMSAEDVFELEQKRIHQDLAKELRQQLAESDRRREESDRRREEAELEIRRLRKMLEERGTG